MLKEYNSKQYVDRSSHPDTISQKLEILTMIAFFEVFCTIFTNEVLVVTVVKDSKIEKAVQ